LSESCSGRMISCRDEVCVNFGHHQLEMAVRISAGAGVWDYTAC
jgi:hypothetical protein